MLLFAATASAKAGSTVNMGCAAGKSRLGQVRAAAGWLLVSDTSRRLVTARPANSRAMSTCTGAASLMSSPACVTRKMMCRGDAVCSSGLSLMRKALLA